MPSIAAKHHVILKDGTGAQVALFDKYVSLECQRVVNDVGYFAIKFYDNGDSRFDLFELDCQVEIWRTVPALGLDWYIEFEGFYRKLERTVEDDGRKYITFTGVGYNHLLARRCVAYRAGTVRAEKNDYLEDVMKEYVDENCAVGAAHASRIANGQFSGFTVDAASAIRTSTPVWAGSREFVNLLEVLQELATFGLSKTPTYRALDFQVDRNGAGAFIFKTYPDQLGTDHSETSASPVIFSVEMGNLRDVVYINDRTSEVTRAIVLGMGERSTRKAIARNNAVAASESPWNVIETSVTASTNEFEYQLNAAGDAEIKEKSALVAFTGVPVQQPGTLYGLHYTLGDIVTLRNNGLSFNKKIVSVRISVDERGVETVDIGWGIAPSGIGPIFYDKFTDPNETLVTSHTPNIYAPGVAWGLQTGIYFGSNLSAEIYNDSAYKTTTGPLNDQRGNIVDIGVSDCVITAQAAIVQGGAGANLFYIFFRYITNSNFWALKCDGTQIQLIEYSSGITYTRDSAAGFAPGVYDVTITINGSAISASLFAPGYGTFTVSYTSTAHLTATKYGFNISPINGGAVYIDNLLIDWIRL